MLTVNALMSAIFEGLLEIIGADVKLNQMMEPQ